MTKTRRRAGPALVVDQSPAGTLGPGELDEEVIHSNRAQLALLEEVEAGSEADLSLVVPEVVEESPVPVADDSADDPLVLAAHLGATAPLAELVAGSKAISAVVDALDTYARKAPRMATATELRRLVAKMSKAWEALEATDLFVVQYNPEFGAIVEACVDATAALTGGLDDGSLELPTQGDDATVRRLLAEAADRLEEYSWEPDL